MADENKPVPAPPANMVGATTNPQAPSIEGKAPISQKQSPSSISSGYAPSTSQPKTNGSAPITKEGNYYQSRATELGLMEQSPKQAKLPEMSVSLGSQQPGEKMLGGGAANNMLNRQLTQQMQGVGPLSGKEARYGTGGIMKTPTAFNQPNASSYQSGTSLTNSIPNIMADNGVQSALGSVTQPVSTGLMRGVPKKPTFQAPAAQMVDLWDDSSVLDNI